MSNLSSLSSTTPRQVTSLDIGILTHCRVMVWQLTVGELLCSAEQVELFFFHLVLNDLRTSNGSCFQNVLPCLIATAGMIQFLSEHTG